MQDDQQNDLRCCGSGTCIINPEGVCWCGQKWDGTKMCMPSLDTQISASVKEATDAKYP